MAFTAYSIKKTAVLIFSPVISAVMFFVGLEFYGFLWSFAFLAAGVGLGYVLGFFLLKNPFSDMLEGKGILCFNMDSKGIIRPFIVAVNPPYVKAKYKNRNIEDVFDKDAVQYFQAPEKMGVFTQLSSTVKKPDGTKQKKMYNVLWFDEDKFNDARNALRQYPVLIYNEQIGSLMTKSFFKEKEDTTNAKHTILYANKKMQELNTNILNFARHVVDSATKPRGNILSNPIFWIIVVIAIVIIVAMFIPGTIDVVSGSMGGGLITPN